MELEVHSIDATEADHIDESTDFPHITAVATRWTLDFMFVSLCRHFKENREDAFDETLSSFEAVSQSPSLKGSTDDKKVLICAFLARVVHGKQLDVQYEKDRRVMPLMSAAKIWSDLKDTVADKSLFKNITVLLLVQSVAVCLEKGRRSSASSALKWFEENHELPQSLKAKLSTVVTERETYHPFLMSFSFSRLLDTVQSFLDDYLEKNPSDYLLKAATKVVRSLKKNRGLSDVRKREHSQTEIADDSSEDAKESMNTGRVRIRRKLLSTKITDVWKPDSCKKSVVCVQRISEHELSQVSPRKPADTSNIQKARAARQKWTTAQDKQLEKGVRCHGLGKWSRILLDYDFEGRSGTMLKDRWRILVKTNKVS
ncbi:telomeric repeat-binding factor 1 [Notolabrus celidotus]|uniref:telomeric repeat-binding factor 1 n=1 Tax=Notolabrus celidotus TaxID=1203425 RepID=UPI00148FB0B1|nr:telomeric repeat-binding factor 1 [Notolabrus celidotus]